MSTDIAVGDRVAFIFAAGSYATHTLAPAERVVPLPDKIGFEEAAAVLFQGLTAHYLATSTFPLGPASSCLVHSAAGGCGILLCQIAKIRGAEVIGAVSTPAKAAIAREAGADHVVVYAEEDFAAAVKRITSGRGVDVVYDAVGLDTYIRSMDSLRPRGLLALYGEASGLVPPIDPRELLFRKSLFLTRTGLDHYIADRRELRARTDELFAWAAEGRLKQKVFRTYRLEENSPTLPQGPRMTGRLPPSSTERKCSSSGSLKHAFEPSLFEPKSPLPGNGIFRPETNGPKRRRSSRRGARETKPTRRTPPIRG